MQYQRWCCGLSLIKPQEALRHICSRSAPQSLDRQTQALSTFKPLDQNEALKQDVK